MVEGKQRKERNKTKMYPNRQVSMDLFIYFRKHTHTKKQTFLSLSFRTRNKKLCVCVLYPHPTHLPLYSLPFFFFFVFFDERKRSILFTNPRREKDFAIFSVDHLTAKKTPKRGSFGIFVTNGRNINSFPFVRTHTEKAREFCEFVFFP